MINVVQGTTKKPITAKRLADFFSQDLGINGQLFIGYPIIGTAEGPFPIDALLVSKETGLVIFNFIEGLDVEGHEEKLDDFYNKVESKLKSHRSLMNGRKLTVELYPVTFAPAKEALQLDVDSEHPICNESNLATWLGSLSWQDSSSYESLVSIVQSISTIRKGRKKRDTIADDSRGAILKSLEDSIANLDNLQGRAVIETVDGVQRIRGLAGSGKTIVLALKAAYLHAQHPDWNIAVTFNTRSLKAQFKHLINTFSIEQTNEEPDWNKIHIIHAWGAPGGGDSNGLYYTFCKAYGAKYYDYMSAKRKFGQELSFEGACEAALTSFIGSEPLYDVILVDEAQDFPVPFLKICYQLLTSDKRLVYAYDELQNLGSQSLPSPEYIFGNDANGKPLVVLTNEAGKAQQDIILRKCYRNSRPVLATAHALGFGIYRDADPETGTGLVQIFENSTLWEDVGYKVTDGKLQDGEKVTLSRTDESSPSFLENHSDIDDIVQFHKFDTKSEQASWLVDQIARELSTQELRTDDIVVINPDPISTRKEVGPIRKLLFNNGINSHLAGVDTSPDIFFDSDNDSIAFTGIYRAKGNEAGMVYVVNAQDCVTTFGNKAKLRNRLFTAITRSKAWVRVLGVGEDMEQLKREFQRVKDNDFSLDFVCPTEDQRKHLNIVNRDMSDAEREKVAKNKNELSRLLDDLENGDLYPEDLGSNQIERLKRLLDKGF